MANSSELLKYMIRERAKAVGLSIKDVAKKSKMSPPQLSRYLTTDKVPSLSVIDRLAAALDCQPWELIKPEGAKPTPEPKQAGNAELLAAVAKLQARVDELEAALRPERRSSAARPLLEAISHATPEEFDAILVAVEAIIGPIDTPPSESVTPKKTTHE